MKYSEISPPATLEPWVRCFWFLTTDQGGPQPVVPDGRLELVLHRAAPFARILSDGSVHCQDAVMVSGQLTRPILLRPTGPADIIGIRFRTAGARDLLGSSVVDLVDQIIPLDRVAPAFASALERAASDVKPVAAITKVLHRHLQSNRHPSTAHVVRRLSRGAPMIEIARALDVSRRTLERHVRDDTGLPPKVLQRIMRFRSYYAALQAAHDTWAGAAVREGYYDQAHANRDFRQFAGTSPMKHFAAKPELAQAFLSHSS